MIFVNLFLITYIFKIRTIFSKHIFVRKVFVTKYITRDLTFLSNLLFFCLSINRGFITFVLLPLILYFTAI
jgi:hypothetical protein